MELSAGSSQSAAGRASAVQRPANQTRRPSLDQLKAAHAALAALPSAHGPDERGGSAVLDGRSRAGEPKRPVEESGNAAGRRRVWRAATSRRWHGEPVFDRFPRQLMEQVGSSRWTHPSRMRRGSTRATAITTTPQIHCAAVFRVRYQDEGADLGGVDPSRGSVVRQNERITRLRRWLYQVCTAWISVPLLPPALWDIVAIALSVGGLVLSVRPSCLHCAGCAVRSGSQARPETANRAPCLSRRQTEAAGSFQEPHRRLTSRVRGCAPQFRAELSIAPARAFTSRRLTAALGIEVD
jgi:hypothetical protein